MSNDDARMIPSPPSRERGRVRGQRGRSPQYGKHRTRSAAARDFARQLRKKSTDAEKRLWRLLRKRRFNEFKFRRQYACGIYFLDFYCTVAKLAVELDGGGHGLPKPAPSPQPSPPMGEREFKHQSGQQHETGSRS